MHEAFADRTCIEINFHKMFSQLAKCQSQLKVSTVFAVKRQIKKNSHTDKHTHTRTGTFMVFTNCVPTFERDESPFEFFTFEKK